MAEEKDHKRRQYIPPKNIDRLLLEHAKTELPAAFDEKLAEFAELYRQNDRLPNTDMAKLYAKPVRRRML